MAKTQFIHNTKWKIFRPECNLIYVQGIYPLQIYTQCLILKSLRCSYANCTWYHYARHRWDFLHQKAIMVKVKALPKCCQISLLKGHRKDILVRTIGWIIGKWKVNWAAQTSVPCKIRDKPGVTWKEFRDDLKIAKTHSYTDNNEQFTNICS